MLGEPAKMCFKFQLSGDRIRAEEVRFSLVRRVSCDSLNVLINQMELDSKQLFIKAEFLFRQVNWIDDWQYIGFESGLEERFAKILDTSFDTEKVVLIRTRHDSAILLQSEIRSLLFEGLCNSSFKIWNLDFVTALEFSEIGVYRKGRVS